MNKKTILIALALLIGMFGITFYIQNKGNLKGKTLTILLKNSLDKEISKKDSSLKSYGDLKCFSDKTYDMVCKIQNVTIINKKDIFNIQNIVLKNPEGLYLRKQLEEGKIDPKKVIISGTESKVAIELNGITINNKDFADYLSLKLNQLLKSYNKESRDNIINQVNSATGKTFSIVLKENTIVDKKLKLTNEDYVKIKFKQFSLSGKINFSILDIFNTIELSKQKTNNNKLLKNIFVNKVEFSFDSKNKKLIRNINRAFFSNLNDQQYNELIKNNIKTANSIVDQMKLKKDLSKKITDIFTGKTSSFSVKLINKSKINMYDFILYENTKNIKALKNTIDIDIF